MFPASCVSAATFAKEQMNCLNPSFTSPNFVCVSEFIITEGFNITRRTPKGNKYGQTSLYLRAPRVSQPVVEQWVMCNLCSDETAV